MKISKYLKVVSGGVIILFSFFAFFCSQKNEKTEQIESIIAEVNIPVEGMICGSCEHHIETEVKQKEGIVEINADHEKAFAFVKYDSSKISLDELVAAINRTGYKATKPN
ncbi:MAG: heavy-metal-associated domain-containing protein [bacterium]|nr:MAG: heavy-metal-associated domain-containing protein [bacterium]